MQRSDATTRRIGGGGTTAVTGCQCCGFPRRGLEAISTLLEFRELVKATKKQKCSPRLPIAATSLFFSPPLLQQHSRQKPGFFPRRPRLQPFWADTVPPRVPPSCAHTRPPIFFYGLCATSSEKRTPLTCRIRYLLPCPPTSTCPTGIATGGTRAGSANIFFRHVCEQKRRI